MKCECCQNEFAPVQNEQVELVTVCEECLDFHGQNVDGVACNEDFERCYDDYLYPDYENYEGDY